jgi:HAD superfamily hydrolase (TIGR01549 family)
MAGDEGKRGGEMKYKAIFFDRDDTLTMNDPEWERLRIQKLEEWSGRSFDTSHEFFVKMFERVMQGGFSFAPYKNVEQELAFFRQWFLFVFDELGITEKREERADFLTEHLWYLKKKLYPETTEVLGYFKSHGYKMGVISDCPPSLELTLQNCGIHDYFTSFTASSLVGAGKPNPIIFNAALNAQNVAAAESIYVDNYELEATGAREQGFTSFHLDRSGEQSGKWVIYNLRGLVDFAESEAAK